MVMLDPDLYAVLPPDKKKEYEEMFPVPKRTPVTKSFCDSSGMYWFYHDYEFLIVPEEWTKELKTGGYGAISLPSITGGYISSVEGEKFGAVCLIPPCGAPVIPCLPCEYNSHRTSREIGLSPGEQRLIKKGVVNK